MVTALSVMSYFLFYGFSNFGALQTVHRLQEGKRFSSRTPEGGPPTPAHSWLACGS